MNELKEAVDRLNDAKRVRRPIDHQMDWHALKLVLSALDSATARADRAEADRDGYRDLYRGLKEMIKSGEPIDWRNV